VLGRRFHLDFGGWNRIHKYISIRARSLVKKSCIQEGLERDPVVRKQDANEKTSITFSKGGFPTEK